MIHRIDRGRLVRALLVLALPLAAACKDDALMPPTAADPIFDRYVSMGNSLTAGFQSGGINDSTQREAYPVLLAQAMGTEFTVPFLASPGCPAPYVNIFEQTRVGGAAARAESAESHGLLPVCLRPPPSSSGGARGGDP